MSTKMIVLKSFEGESFEVEEAVTRQSKIMTLLVEEFPGQELPLTNVTSDILGKVIEYCKKHVVVEEDVGGGGGDSSSASVDEEEALKKWDEEFVKEMDESSMLMDLLMAANYLDIQGLLDVTCKKVADMIDACKDEKEIRAKFNIENDLTEDEVERIRMENRYGY